MSESEIHVGAINLDFVSVIKEDGAILDISTATEKIFYFTKPNGQLLTKTASFVNDGTDGLIHYATVSGDIDIAGIWKVQAKVSFGSSVYPSDIHAFRVYKNLF